MGTCVVDPEASGEELADPEHLPEADNHYIAIGSLPVSYPSGRIGSAAFLTAQGAWVWLHVSLFFFFSPVAPAGQPPRACGGKVRHPPVIQNILTRDPPVSEYRSSKESGSDAGARYPLCARAC